jgi:hypothetical protein
VHFELLDEPLEAVYVRLVAELGCDGIYCLCVVQLGHSMFGGEALCFPDVC